MLKGCHSTIAGLGDPIGATDQKNSVGAGTIGSADRKGSGRAEIVMAAYHTLQYAARRTQTSPVLPKAGLFLAFRPTEERLV